MIEIVVGKTQTGDWVAQTSNVHPALAFVDPSPKRALKKLAKMLDEEQVFDG